MDGVTVTGAGDSPPSHDDVSLMQAEEISEEQHPLTIDLVLKELFRNLPQSDLARCRLVSRQWYKESLPEWMDTATLTLQQGWIIVEPEDDDGDGDPYKVSLGQFLDYWEASEAKPFRRFHLEDWNCQGAQPSPNLFDIVGFWQQVGSYITRLLLTNHHFSGIREFRKAVYQLCPNMKYLSITNCNVQGSNFLHSDQVGVYKKPGFGEHRHLTSLIVGGCYPDSWLDLLAHFTSLNFVRLRFDRSQLETVTRNFLLAVQTVRTEYPGKLPLKVTYFDNLKYSATPDSAEIFQLLLELRLPIHDFRIRLDNRRELNSQYVDLLRDNSETIKRMFVGYCGKSLGPQFPVGVILTKLQFLEIIDISFFHDLHFLKSTPNLADLRHNHLTGSHGVQIFTNTSAETMAGVRLLKMKKLCLECNLTEDDLRNLIKWMPNVEMAALTLDDAKFTLVCGNWRELRGLFDFGWKLSDKGLLGLSKDEEEGTLPNLTQLKRLEYFGTESKHPTKMSVYDGLLKLPFLKSVVLPEHLIGYGEDLRAEGIRLHQNLDLKQFVEDCLDGHDMAVFSPVYYRIPYSYIIPNYGQNRQIMRLRWT